MRETATARSDMGAVTLAFTGQGTKEKPRFLGALLSGLWTSLDHKVAYGAGFEPTDGCPSTVFKIASGHPGLCRPVPERPVEAGISESFLPVVPPSSVRYRPVRLQHAFAKTQNAKSNSLPPKAALRLCPRLCGHPNEKGRPQGAALFTQIN